LLPATAPLSPSSFCRLCSLPFMTTSPAWGEASRAVAVARGSGSLNPHPRPPFPTVCLFLTGRIRGSIGVVVTGVGRRRSSPLPLPLSLACVWHGQGNPPFATLPLTLFVLRVAWVWSGAVRALSARRRPNAGPLSVAWPSIGAGEQRKPPLVPLFSPFRREGASAPLQFFSFFFFLFWLLTDNNTNLPHHKSNS